MSDITREELDAKLETIMAKMDARVASIDGKIDSFLAAQVERDKRIDAEFARNSATSAEIKSSLTSMKTTLIVTALSTVIAIVLGIGAFNATLTSNMMTAFQLGKGEASSAPAAPIIIQQPMVAPPKSAAPVSPAPDTPPPPKK